MSILIQDLLERLFKYSAYDENGQLTESFEVSPGSSSTGSPQVVGFSVELGRWHNTECLESGTVIMECKDGKYEPIKKEDILERQQINNSMIWLMVI